MKLVVDQNYLVNPKLSELLKGGHEIILTDDFFIEQFKSSNAEKYFKRNLKKLLDFPEQISVSVDRTSLLGKELSERRPLRRDDIIDEEGTMFVRQLLSDKKRLSSIDYEEWEHQAKKRLRQFSHRPEFFSDLAGKLTQLMKKENTKAVYKIDSQKRKNDIKETVFLILEQYLRNKGIEEADRKLFRQRISINFAQTYSHLWRVVDWSIRGGFQNAKKAIKGDGFDIKYIQISSFFDCLLTNEKWMKKCRKELLGAFK